jgi:hypothetical protein
MSYGAARPEFTVPSCVSWPSEEVASFLPKNPNGRSCTLWAIPEPWMQTLFGATCSMPCSPPYAGRSP